MALVQKVWGLPYLEYILGGFPEWLFLDCWSILPATEIYFWWGFFWGFLCSFAFRACFAGCYGNSDDRRLLNPHPNIFTYPPMVLSPQYFLPLPICLSWGNFLQLKISGWQWISWVLQGDEDRTHSLFIAASFVWYFWEGSEGKYEHTVLGSESPSYMVHSSWFCLRATGPINTLCSANNKNKIIFCHDILSYFNIFDTENIWQEYSQFQIPQYQLAESNVLYTVNFQHGCHMSPSSIMRMEPWLFYHFNPQEEAEHRVVNPVLC